MNRLAATYTSGRPRKWSRSASRAYADGGKLKVAFRHRGSVGAGVFNRGGDEYRACHGGNLHATTAYHAAAATRNAPGLGRRLQILLGDVRHARCSSTFGLSGSICTRTLKPLQRCVAKNDLPIPPWARANRGSIGHCRAVRFPALAPASERSTTPPPRPAPDPFAAQPQQQRPAPPPPRSPARWVVHDYLLPRITRSGAESLGYDAMIMPTLVARSPPLRLLEHAELPFALDHAAYSVARHSVSLVRS